MAERYYIQGASGAWADTANWSATSGGSGSAGVPGASDNATFDANGSGTCTLDANAACTNLTIGTSGSAYAGTIDAATFDVAISGDFDCSDGGSASVDFGSGTWTVGGDIDVSALLALEGGSSLLVLTGTSKTAKFNSNSARAPFNMTISGSYTTSASASPVDGDVIVSGSYTNNRNFDMMGSSKTITIESGGTWTQNVGGSRDLNIRAATLTVAVGGTLNGTGIVGSTSNNWAINGAGTWSVATTNMKQGGVVGAGTYGGTISFIKNNTGTRTTTFGTGSGQTIIFSGDVIYHHNKTGTWTVDFSTHNPDIEYKGDATILSDGGGTLTWSKGTGGITLNGAGTQAIDFDGESIEDVTISNTGGIVTFGSNFTTDALTQGQDSSIAEISLGAVTITMAGNFLSFGAVGHPTVWNGPDLVVSGTAVAKFCTATNSDASGGTTVTATDNCIDGGGNTDWTFSAVSYIPYPLYAMTGGMQPMAAGAA